MHHKFIGRGAVLCVKALALLCVVLFFVQAFAAEAFAAGKNSADADGLGLIIKSIEMVEEKPILVAIYSVKNGKTIEYTVGDYVEGKFVRDILADRVVLYDEISKYQYVLIYNDMAGDVEEEDEDDSVSVIRTREKKRENEDMDVTYQFNKFLGKAQGREPLKMGGSDSAAENEEKNKLNKAVRNFKDEKSGPVNKSAEVKPGSEAATVEVNVTPGKAPNAAPATAEVAVGRETGKKTPAGPESKPKPPAPPNKSGAAETSEAAIGGNSPKTK